MTAASVTDPSLADAAAAATAGAAGAAGETKPKKLECDYDVNPSILYQAIEAKQWEYAYNVFKSPEAGREAATWVFRKETNGQLRWRLLPIHAAIIFGSPLKLVELLLAEYPQGAQCKDDQGMLPLHLCFRNEVAWEIIEEIITAYPEAYYVKDRKGRTPLSCGVRNTHSSAQSISSQSHRGAVRTKSSFKSALSVLGLMTDIAVNAEMQKVRDESRTILESRVAQLQETHLQTLTQLKKEWHKQRDESKRNTAVLQDEIDALKAELAATQAENAELRIAEGRLADRVEELTADVNLKESEIRHLHEQDYVVRDRDPSDAPVVSDRKAEPTDEDINNSETVKTLKAVVENLARDQKEYHARFGELVIMYEGLAMERKRIMEVFGRQSQEQFNKELDLVQGFQNWMEEKEAALLAAAENDDGDDVEGQANDNTGEEKKDDHPAYAERSEFSEPRMKVAVSKSADGPAAGAEPSVIDLSNAPSPKSDP